jgi:hypothetical protein
MARNIGFQTDDVEVAGADLRAFIADIDAG